MGNGISDGHPVEIYVRRRSRTGEAQARLRDSILDLLTPKTYKDLMDLREAAPPGRFAGVKQHLSKGKVPRWYITDFVVQ
jgi:hypothetical protein